ncbi:MAG: hypothetical protein HRU18_02715 [Pseudoalteromonas sp.]|uniref:hypothetical protein n=1 Tax=Pseudoalteromonas sp. TaxID=53249 RepID=UPI001D8FD59E|nr:hypothetical protein [Pseudoalteromonas sp.]NRA77096.1 hypothetical protein [Pseudoalteromonas sp.]
MNHEELIAALSLLGLVVTEEGSGDGLKWWDMQHMLLSDVFIVVFDDATSCTTTKCPDDDEECVPHEEALAQIQEKLNE